MTTPQWLSAIARPEITPEIEGHIWRYHRSHDDQFFAEYLPDDFLKLLEQAPQKGWKTVVEEGLQGVSGQVHDFSVDYFLKSYRSDFVEKLNLKEGSKVLDLGCGWGFASQRCLEKGAFVVACEAAVKRLRFCATRFSQEGYDDKFVCVEFDANRDYPFQNGAFDAIIVSGLMEWLPCSVEGDPDEIQAAFLRKMFGLLAPGGCLYVAIENRYWGPYFRGARDEHTFQRFLSIAPRKMADAISQNRIQKGYRAYCHSFLTYGLMLSRAGFVRLDIDVPKPGYNTPKIVAPLVRGVALKRSAGALKRALWRANQSLHDALFAHSFMLFARKANEKNQ